MSAQRIALVFALALALVACGGPSSEVREGRVAAKKFEVAHEHHYYILIMTSQICTRSGTSQICTPIMTPFPQSNWVPDRWSITIVGCKRLEKDDVKTYCDKPSQRKLYVGQTEFNRLKVGDDYTIPKVSA